MTISNSAMILKSILFLFIAVPLWSGCGVPVHAETPQDGAASIHAEVNSAKAAVIHDELRAFHKQLIDGLNKGDVEGLMSMVHEDIIFVPMDGQMKRGIAETQAYLDKMITGKNPIVKKLTVEMKAEGLTMLHGEEMGVAYGTSVDTFELTTGTTFVAKTRWTATLIKVEGRWKVAAFQNAVSVFDDSVRDQFK